MGSAHTLAKSAWRLKTPCVLDQTVKPSWPSGWAREAWGSR